MEEKGPGTKRCFKESIVELRQEYTNSGGNSGFRFWGLGWALAYVIICAEIIAFHNNKREHLHAMAEKKLKKNDIEN